MTGQKQVERKLRTPTITLMAQALHSTMQELDGILLIWFGGQDIPEVVS